MILDFPQRPGTVDATIRANGGQVDNFPLTRAHIKASIVDGCIFGLDEEVVWWVGRHLGEDLGKMAVGIGVVSETVAPGAGLQIFPDEPLRIIGGVAYHGFVRSVNCTSVMVSIAGYPGWLTPKRLDLLLGYPFRQLQCDRVDAIIDEENVRSIRLCEGLGFTRIGRFPRQYGERGGLIYCLLSEQFLCLDLFMRTEMRAKHG